MARSAYTEREPNKYGEISKKVIGVFNQLKAGVEVVLTRLKRWRLVRKQDKAQASSDAQLISARSAAWSSVNNCTEQNLNNYQEEVCSGEKIDDVSDEERLSALISRKRDWLLS